MKASINSWLAWLFAKRYESRPPRGVTRRWLSGGVPPGGDRSPEGATGNRLGGGVRGSGRAAGPARRPRCRWRRRACQEVGYVLLDRVERHHQVVGDATVGQARSEQ